MPPSPKLTGNATTRAEGGNEHLAARLIALVLLVVVTSSCRAGDPVHGVSAGNGVSVGFERPDGGTEPGKPEYEIELGEEAFGEGFGDYPSPRQED